MENLQAWLFSNSCGQVLKIIRSRGLICPILVRRKRTFPHEWENNHAYKGILDNFPGIIHMSAFLDNYWTKYKWGKNCKFCRFKYSTTNILCRKATILQGHIHVPRPSLVPSAFFSQFPPFLLPYFTEETWQKLNGTPWDLN